MMLAICLNIDIEVVLIRKPLLQNEKEENVEEELANRTSLARMTRWESFC